SACSADGPSMMSQPVRKASAPRLAPPRRNARRVGSGMSLAASLISSLGSTPGGLFRMRDIAFLLLPEHDLFRKSVSTFRDHALLSLRMSLSENRFPLFRDMR